MIIRTPRILRWEKRASASSTNAPDSGLRRSYVDVENSKILARHHDGVGRRVRRCRRLSLALPSLHGPYERKHGGDGGVSRRRTMERGPLSRFANSIFSPGSDHRHHPNRVDHSMRASFSFLSRSDLGGAGPRDHYPLRECTPGRTSNRNRHRILSACGSSGALNGSSERDLPTGWTLHNTHVLYHRDADQPFGRSGEVSLLVV